MLPPYSIYVLNIIHKPHALVRVSPPELRLEVTSVSQAGPTAWVWTAAAVAAAAVVAGCWLVALPLLSARRAVSAPRPCRPRACFIELYVNTVANRMSTKWQRYTAGTAKSQAQSTQRAPS
eukprot:gene7288-biopygen8795